MARECPVKPQELRIDAWRIQQVCRDARHAEHGICEPCFAMVQRIRRAADHLEQSREQPAVPSSTQPQELPLSERMRNWDKHNQPSGASEYADKVADLERRNAELLADKERLDWLEDAGFPLVIDCWGSHPQFEVREGVSDFNGRVLAAHNSIREAIDAARGKES